MAATPEPESVAASATVTGPPYQPDEQAAPLQVTELTGGVVSCVGEPEFVTSTSTLCDVVTLPAVSVARAATAADPSGNVWEFQVKSYGADVTVPRTVPLTRKSTLAMPDASDAVAENGTAEPLTTAPSVGWVSVTLGAVWSLSPSDQSSVVMLPTDRRERPTEMPVAPAGNAGVVHESFV